LNARSEFRAFSTTKAILGYFRALHVHVWFRGLCTCDEGVECGEFAVDYCYNLISLGYFGVGFKQCERVSLDVADGDHNRFNYRHGSRIKSANAFEISGARSLAFFFLESLAIIATAVTIAVRIDFLHPSRHRLHEHRQIVVPMEVGEEMWWDGVEQKSAAGVRDAGFKKGCGSDGVNVEVQRDEVESLDVLLESGVARGRPRAP